MTGPIHMEAPARPSVTEVIPVAGVVPLTTLDFPGRLALVVFTQGCPWRCPYCHNAALRPVDTPTSWCWSQVCDLLEERQDFLEAVVFSGGEPTLHDGLLPALHAVRRLGLLTGLHTAGIFPNRLLQVLPWLDWVGLDIKAPFGRRYAQVTGDPRSVIKVLTSLVLVQSWGIPFQLRTTVGPGALNEEGFEELCRQLQQLDAPEPVRQQVRPAREIRPGITVP